MIQEIEGESIGVTFQRAVRSPEWKAALIVYEKYKRKLNLEYKDLIKLKDFVVTFSENRKAQGKKVSDDYLIQIASGEIKKFENKI